VQTVPESVGYFVKILPYRIVAVKKDVRESLIDKDPRFHYQVVGLVRDTHYRAVREDILPIAYIPFHSINATTGAPEPQDRATFMVRTTGAIPASLASTLRLEMAKARPDFLVSRIRTQIELVKIQTVRERLFASLGSFFAGVALLLAGVGLYGVLLYSVQQRRRAIAIRMAIGAEASNIVTLVTIPLFITVISGALTGILAGVFASRYLGSVFFQVHSTDAQCWRFPRLASSSRAASRHSPRRCAPYTPTQPPPSAPNRALLFRVGVHHAGSH
jgi:hypothetical protein